MEVTMSVPIRLLQTVLAVPVGGWVSTEAVASHLYRLGYRIGLRSVQRDLNKLAGPFAIEQRGYGPTREWSRKVCIEQVWGGA